MSKPEAYKLLNMGRYLQRRASTLRKAANTASGTKAMRQSERAMTLVEAEHAEQVGDWLVEQSRQEEAT